MRVGWCIRILGYREPLKNPFPFDGGRLGRVDKIEIFVIPAKAGIYEDVHQVIIGLKTPGFRFKTGMTGYLSTRPRMGVMAAIS